MPGVARAVASHSVGAVPPLGAVVRWDLFSHATKMPPKKRRNRLPVSCVACQRVKAKCERAPGGGWSCRRCARMGHECEFGPPQAIAAAHPAVVITACSNCRRIKVSGAKGGSVTAHTGHVRIPSHQ